MLSVLDAYTTDLPATKTYGRRSICWIPAYPNPQGFLGQLIIKLQHSKSGVGRNVEVDTYSVEADTPEPGDNGGSAFWLSNLSDPAAEEPYRVVLGGLNAKTSCKCTAGKCRVPGEPDVTEGCKHRDSLGLLIAEGFIEGVEHGHSVTTERTSGDHDGSGIPQAAENAWSEPFDGGEGNRRLPANDNPLVGRHDEHRRAEPPSHPKQTFEVTREERILATAP